MLMLPEMLAMAFSAFMVRMFTHKTSKRRLALAACLLTVLYGCLRMGSALISLMREAPEWLSQVSSGYVVLAIVVGIAQYCLPLCGYGLAAFVQKVRERYSIRIIAEV